MDSPTDPRTIAELAARLGVSAMTVHRAIAGKPDVSAKTRERILAEVERIGWRPNMAARGLRQGKTYTLGILVSDVAASFLPEVLRGVHQTAEAQGYHSILCVHAHEVSRAERHLRTLQSKGVDGIVHYPTEQGGELATLNEVARTTPVAVVMRELRGFRGPTVVVDDVQGGHLAVSHLLELGHRRIGFVGYTSLEFSGNRQRGAEQALREAGLPLPEEWRACVSRQAIASGAAEQILRRPDRPTALFCASDRLAARVIQAATALDIDVPRDLSVMGYGGDPWGELLRVPLTTVAQPRLQVGEQAALLALGTAGLTPDVVVLAPWLEARSSTRRLLPTRGT